METLSQFGPSILLVFKLAILLFLIIYIIFAGIVVKQVRIMTETLQVGMEQTIRMLSVVHFIISLIVFVLAVFILP